MPHDEPKPPPRSKERELAFIEERIRAAKQGAPSGRLIRQAVAGWIAANDLTDDDYGEVQWRLTPYVAYLLELDLADAEETTQAFCYAGLMAEGMLAQRQAAGRRHG